MRRTKRKKNRPPPEGYVLPPGVTHPQGRPGAFADAMKAMIRGFIEVKLNPPSPMPFAERIESSPPRPSVPEVAAKET
jgi:hypothetical protein